MAKVLFITGASNGIGAATARAASAAGHTVALMARSQETLQALAADLPGPHLLLPGNVTDFAAQEAAIAQIMSEYGRLDAVFANAGRGLDQPGTEAGDPAEWRAMLEVNIMGVLWTARLALPHLRAVQGHFLVTGSAAGRAPIKGSIYGASKWFVHGFAQNLAAEMADWGGRCTVIAPGMVDTPFFDTPKPDKLQAEDVARAVLHALDAPQRANVREIFVMPTQMG
jgi:NADP-dependent 3-hydroxy acid dehydrogenase YdfG